MKKHPYLFTASLCVLCIALTLLSCTAIFVYRFGGREGLRDAFRFAEARRTILTHFVGETNGETLTDGALYGMAEATEDRWSYYMTQEEYAQYLQYISNQYTGIGITVSSAENDRGLSIVTVQPDSPADKAGIEAGMRLLKVNETDMIGQSAAYAREVILAAAEADILLELETTEGERITLTVRAETLKVQVVSDEMLDGGIGYIRIANFEDGAADGAIASLDKLLEEGAAGIVFDVRSNPGGKLNELVKLLDYLLPEGVIFVSQSKDGEEVLQLSGAECVSCPMVVLIDENSYSAAEFFAAALSEYNWATLVGAQTSGKSRSQVNIPLSDGVLHLSTASYLTPHRVDLTEVGGLTPDILIALDGSGDTQLDAAVEYLQTKE